MIDRDKLPQERWRAVSGYEGFYEVSNIGRVRSVARTINGKVHEGQLLILGNSRGYRNASLRNGTGAKTTYSVHKLVAEAFILKPETPFELEINHINFDRADNRIENLEWVSRVENMRHARVNNRFDPVVNANIGKKLDAETVKQIKRRIRDGETHTAIAKSLNISRTNVGKIHNGKIWKSIADY